MPTYEYECKSCSHHFELFQSMSDPVLKECPVCGKEVRRLILGGAGVIFKGSGFYVTDKTGKASDKPEAAKTDAAKTDTAKPEAAKDDSAAADKSPKSETVKTEGGSEKGSSVKSNSVKTKGKTAQN